MSKEKVIIRDFKTYEEGLYYLLIDRLDHFLYNYLLKIKFNQVVLVKDGSNEYLPLEIYTLFKKKYDLNEAKKQQALNDFYENLRQKAFNSLKSDVNQIQNKIEKSYEKIRFQMTSYFIEKLNYYLINEFHKIQFNFVNNGIENIYRHLPKDLQDEIRDEEREKEDRERERAKAKEKESRKEIKSLETQFKEEESSIKEQMKGLKGKERNKLNSRIETLREKMREEIEAKERRADPKGIKYISFRIRSREILKDFPDIRSIVFDDLLTIKKNRISYDTMNDYTNAHIKPNPREYDSYLQRKKSLDNEMKRFLAKLKDDIYKRAEKHAQKVFKEFNKALIKEVRFR